MWWKNVEKIMNRRKITIYRLSKETGIAWSTIKNYKNGAEPPVSNAYKIADALGVSLDDLRRCQ